MQNKYAGDVGDFGKFGLLRNIARSGLIIGVNWYLVADELHNNDGKFIESLKKPDFKECDDELLNKLNYVASSNQRSVYILESLNLIPNAIYYNEEDLCTSHFFGLKFVRYSTRYYFFFIQPKHVKQVQEAVNCLLNSKWSLHFKSLPL